MVENLPFLVFPGKDLLVSKTSRGRFERNNFLSSKTFLRYL